MSDEQPISEETTPAITKSRLRAMPKSPGVYLMKDRQGDVIYIGKAKDLRARVRSYFSGSDDRLSIPFLVEQVTFIDTLVTEDERQALVLEADLIRKYKPKYNIRLKDDRAYLIVRIDINHEWPKLQLVRQRKDDGARYIGPFAFAYELRTLIEAMQRSIPLRTCSDRVIYNRVRPCLEYQIKRCCGPCCIDVDKVQYLAWVDQAVRILQGNTKEVIAELKHDMARASEETRFEDAAEFRDRIRILNRIGEERHERMYGNESFDAFAMYREGGNAELSVMLVRDGRLAESKTFGFTNVQVPDEAILSSVLTQFYEGDATFPDAILLPFVLEDRAVREEWYSERRAKSVQLQVPKRGRKHRVMELTKTNAKQNFEARFSEVDRRGRILEALRDELQLEQVPRTIECVDISHFQGGATVGAIVALQEMSPDKSRYRCFHLSQEEPDDFASMREVLMRHLSRSAEDNTLPDLLVVDGGQAQLSQALAVRKELGLLQPALIALAKKRTGGMHYRAYEGTANPKAVRKPERIYLEDSTTPIVLDPRSEVLHLLERVRNEAHRFAITFHRKTRKKKTVRSALDRIPGVGPKRRDELLRQFRSVAKIKEATAEEISTACGIPSKLAQRILDALCSDE